METLIIQSDSKKTIDLLVELSKQLKLKPKRFSKSQLEDLLLVQSIDEGRKSGYASKQQVMKSLKK